jgi:histone H2A
LEKTSSVYITGVLEYLCAEILELAGNSAKNNRRKRIKPSDILAAMKGDTELLAIISGELMMAEGGYYPKSIIRN